MESRKSTVSGLFWKMLERFGYQGIQFALQIILARLLCPEHYGVLTLMVIFTTLANVFIQNGFNTALIQKKDASDEDFSSVFWVTLIMALVLYAVLFFSAPLIAGFYNMPDIINPFRVLALILIPGAFNSIQIAKISRELNFKKVFTSNILAIIVSGAVGIVLAYKGFGIWALVGQSLSNTCVACIVMVFTVRWKPKFICDMKRIKTLFSFGWKLLVSGLLETLYQDLRSLVVGKKYDETTLGYYNRGKQFPQFIITFVNSAVQSVMLPTMSQYQDDREKVKAITRKSMTIASFLVFPMMAGLAAVASPLVSILLTDKWLPCVPYLMIYCIALAFMPVHSCNLQAINAVGRSDIFLKLEIIKKTIGIGCLAIAVFCFDTPVAIAMTGVVTTFISCFINAFPNKRLIGYSYIEQMKDILPSFLISAVMFGVVYMVSYLKLNVYITILIQIFTGIFIYLALSALFRLAPLKFIEGYIKEKAKSRKVKK